MKIVEFLSSLLLLSLSSIFCRNESRKEKSDDDVVHTITFSLSQVSDYLEKLYVFRKNTTKFE